MSKATFSQYLQLGQMIDAGSLDREMVQAILEGKVVVRPPAKVTTMFSAPVAYVQPEFEELRRRFPTCLNPDYKGKRFDPIERCKGVPKENREVEFRFIEMGFDSSTDVVLAEMDRMGLRPALYEELLGFAEAYSDIRYAYLIVALGSSVFVASKRYAAYLLPDDEHDHGLDLGYVYSEWPDRSKFLAVRE